MPDMSNITPAKPVAGVIIGWMGKGLVEFGTDTLRSGRAKLLSCSTYYMWQKQRQHLVLMSMEPG
jgi:hypothetical protein